VRQIPLIAPETNRMGPESWQQRKSRTRELVRQFSAVVDLQQKGRGFPLLLASSMPLRLSSVFQKVPKAPALYAMYAGPDRKLDCVYVDVAVDLRSRLIQHFVRRDSSVTTGGSAVTLNPNLVRRVVWWTDRRFSDRTSLEAAELVASKVLKPVLRSRKRVPTKATVLLGDHAFVECVTRLTEVPENEIIIPCLEDALERISRLEDRLQALENRLTFPEGGPSQ